ncbi:MAG TPA: hypothetical protein VK675_00630 [Candidatus Paceibacterota bacterium]|nr:hypothetical protein [Candidatus Paceibacterota bacterium]
MGLFEWGEKRFARGIAKAMIRGYKAYKNYYPNLNDFELLKMTLSNRPGEPAKKLLEDLQDYGFYKEMGGNLLEIIYLLVRLEYIEYMNGTIETENPKTNAIFKNTISGVLEAELS